MLRRLTTTDTRARMAARGRHRHARGTSVIEFTLVLPLLLIMILALIEFGHLIQCRLIVANVAREGGSIASRSLTIDQPLVDLVAVSGHPLVLNGAVGKVVITRITAGTAQNTLPTITTTVTAGSLGMNSSIAAANANLGLPANLYQHLIYKTGRPAPGVNGPDVSDMTVVEVFYNYIPITPLFGFIPGLIPKTGQLLKSRALF
jgi:hypothetical protein